MIVTTASRTKTKQLEEGNQAEGGIDDAPREEERFSEGEDGSWYLGKAKEEFRRQRGKGEPSRGEEDPIQVRVPF
jgi:SEL1 protein